MSITSAPRTDDEIISRINVVADRDFFGFEVSDLVVRLEYEKAKQFIPADVTQKDWEVVSREPADVISMMHDYMPFAWEKANDGRGISAGRSLSHYSAWIWLAGDDLGDLLEYEFYGKDKLVLICNHYGWDSSEWDDGVRTN